MARISIPEENAVSSEVAAIFEEIKVAFGMVPNLFRSYAHFPALLNANWIKVKAVLMDGCLSRKFKESIAVLVSKDNGCQYCVTAHSAMLQAIGIPADEVSTITEDVDSADFSAKEKSLMSFVRRANLAPHRISDEEFDALRRVGITEDEIVEALGTMELFTGFNKYIDALNIDIDF